MKSLKGLLVILMMLVLVGKASSQQQWPTAWDVKSTLMQWQKVCADTVSNNLARKDTVVVNIRDYNKITFYTGSSANDSSHYQFELWGGAGNMWKKIWADSISTVTAKSGVITTDAKMFTYDQDFGYAVRDTAGITSVTTKAYDLFTDLKWIRRTMASGNGTGPAANKTRANDYIVGEKREK